MQRLGKRNQVWSETEIPVADPGEGPGFPRPPYF